MDDVKEEENVKAVKEMGIPKDNVETQSAGDESQWKMLKHDDDLEEYTEDNVTQRRETSGERLREHFGPSALQGPVQC